MTGPDGVPVPRRWLPDDLLALNVVLLVAASSIAIVLTSCLWHYIHPEPPSPEQRTFRSILSTALSSFRIISPPVTQQPILIVPSSQESKDHKGTRSKERRRRGKDPLRDLFKGGKKSKALLKALKTADPDPSQPSAEFSSQPANDTASSTSRSQSPEPAGSLLALDHLTPTTCHGVVSDDDSARDITPNSTSALPSSGDSSDHSSSDACSRAGNVRPHSAPPDAMTRTDTIKVDTTSTVTEHASSKDTPSSPPLIDADVRTPQPRDSHTASMGGSCVELVRARTWLRVAKIDASVKSHVLSSALPDSVASAPTSVHSVASCPSLFIAPSIPSSDGAGPSTPTNPRGPTPSPCEQGRSASVHMQLASMHGALEAARVREEQLRIEAEQASKERDELRWRWNEDAGVWRRREVELQAQIHHLMQQLHAYIAVASFQAQQASNLPSSGFSSPTSPHVQLHPLAPFPLPPAMQAQNSASPPAHVQAILASAPMLPSHPPVFVAPISGNVYSGTGPGMSPLMWSGMGLRVPSRDPRHGGRQTPDSSASGSSSRGRRRRRRPEDVKSTSDDSCLGDWDGAEDGSGEDEWEEDEDIFRNNALADAILKRPESIRGLGSKVRRRPSLHVRENGMGGERIDALKDPSSETLPVDRQ